LAYLGLLAVLVLTVLVACSQRIDSGKHRRPKPKRVLSKNYVIGERQTARLGDPIIRVKDYFVHRSQPFMRATDDFVLKGKGLVVEGYRDEDYTIRGETNVDGKRFTVVSLPPFKRWPYLFKSDGPAALVNKDGTIYNRIMDGNKVLAPLFKLQPAGVRLLPTKQGKILAESVYKRCQKNLKFIALQTIKICLKNMLKKGCLLKKKFLGLLVRSSVFLEFYWD